MALHGLSAVTNDDDDDAQYLPFICKIHTFEHSTKSYFNWYLLAMELQLKIKEEFVEVGHRYIENQLFTSLDHKELKNEQEADSSAMEVKVETKDEFAEDDQRCIETQPTTSLDLKDLNTEKCEDNLNLGKRSNRKVFFIDFI
uniref:Uncharacterized protein LOC114335792 n=1 Tax=Diabrotica virgifera virgifera TaxID=50390 RepID=A0A6P7GAM4_DIAVI